MTEAELRAVLLWRVVQAQAEVDNRAGGRGQGPQTGHVAGQVTEPVADPVVGPLVDPVAAWAGDEARRRLGEHAEPTTWLAERARLALGRLAELHAHWRPVLGHLQGAPLRPLVLGLLAAAALAGLAAGGMAGSTVLNLLAPPLLGLLAWNCMVYLLLAWQALRRPATVPSGAALQGAVLPGTVFPGGALPSAALPGGLLRLMARAQPGLSRLLGREGPADAPRLRALATFRHDWLQATAPLQQARAAAAVHAAAAVLALAALLAWYGCGLVLDFRAGWDSTLLEPPQVLALLHAVLGPAAALTGQALPDAQALAQLRLAQGGGEGAARWMHLWAVTVLAVVVLPRLALAAWAWLRARRLALTLPLPEDEALQRLLRQAGGQPLPLLVLPYSYQLDAARQAALLRLLLRQWGPQVRPRLQASLPQGAEDQLPTRLPLPLPPTVVVLFALTATPERESHAAFLRALAVQRGAAAPPVVVWVDESGFRERLSGATLATRLAQRRQVWQALLAGVGSTAQFIDLATA